MSAPRDKFYPISCERKNLDPLQASALSCQCETFSFSGKLFKQPKSFNDNNEGLTHNRHILWVKTKLLLLKATNSWGCSLSITRPILPGICSPSVSSPAVSSAVAHALMSQVLSSNSHSPSPDPLFLAVSGCQKHFKLAYLIPNSLVVTALFWALILPQVLVMPFI